MKYIIKFYNAAMSEFKYLEFEGAESDAEKKVKGTLEDLHSDENASDIQLFQVHEVKWSIDVILSPERIA